MGQFRNSCNVSSIAGDEYSERNTDEFISSNAKRNQKLVLNILESDTCSILLKDCFFCGGELRRQICVNTSARQTCFVCKIFYTNKFVLLYGSQFPRFTCFDGILTMSRAKDFWSRLQEKNESY